MRTQFLPILWTVAVLTAVATSQTKPSSVPAPQPSPREERFVLWDPTRELPKSTELAPLEGVRFSVIQRREPAVDGYNWLHGVAAVWHGGALWTSFGRNKGDENTATEIAQGRTSTDAGRTWGPVFPIDGGTPGLAVSHGVFLSHKGALWAFHGNFTGKLKDVHTVAYLLDPATGRWLRKATVAAEGYWPTAEPQRMADGNWIMAGFCVAGRNPAAVAISEDDSFTKWRLVKIPLTPSVGRIWGESALVVRGETILCIARWAKPVALAAASNDYGRTWSTMIPTNLPMAASKPYAGLLSTGQQYLICTTTADAGNRRNPLTIAVSRPEHKLFSKVFRIRDAVAEAPGESAPEARLSYPYAVEHEGSLYVVYSNDGARGHNRNSAEMAVIPLRALTVRE